MIVKIQRPLASSGPMPMALVYNSDRSFTAEMPMTSDIEALFKNGELKVYHHAVEKRGKLLIGVRAAEQDF